MRDLIKTETIISALLLLAILLPAAAAYSQEPDIQVMENRLASVRQQEDSLALSIAARRAKVDSLSGAVSRLGNSGFLERSQRDRLLRETQELAQLQEQESAALNRLEELKKNLLNQLSAAYQALEQTLLDSLQSTELPEEARKELTARIGQARERQSEISRLSSRPGSRTATDMAITIDRNDMPVDIEAKALLLRDREEIHRRKARELQERYREMQQESRLRQRLADLVDDVRLFDARDEAVTQAAPARATTEIQNAKFFDNNWEAMVNPADMGGLANTSSVLTANELLSLDIQALPSYDVQDYLNNLDKQQKRLLLEADSLSRVADQFEREAKKLRNSSPRNE